MQDNSHVNEALSKYYDEMWLDQMIEEAFRLTKEKAAKSEIPSGAIMTKLK